MGKLANALFYLIGTCILASISTIVAINIYADSRLFEAKEDYTIMQNDYDSNEKEDNQNNNDIETLKYKRKNTEPSKKPDIKQKEKVLTPVAIKVEIINKSGYDNQIARLKTTLESRGFKVDVLKSTQNNNEFLSAETKIIERNDKGYGIKLRNDLKSGKIYKITKKDYKYDLTLIIGTDYNP